MVAAGGEFSHSYSADVEIDAGLVLLDQSSGLSKEQRAELIARMFGEDVMTSSLEHELRQTFMKFSYQLNASGEWVGNNGRTLEQMAQDSRRAGFNDDHVFQRLLAAQKTLGENPNVNSTLVVSEDIGSGKSFIYLFSRSPATGEIVGHAIEHRGTPEELDRIVERIAGKSTGFTHGAPISFREPIYFERTLGLNDAYAPMLSVLTEGASSKEFLARVKRDSSAMEKLIASQIEQTESLVKEFRKFLMAGSERDMADRLRLLAHLAPEIRKELLLARSPHDQPARNGFERTLENRTSENDTWHKPSSSLRAPENSRQPLTARALTTPDVWQTPVSATFESRPHSLASNGIVITAGNATVSAAGSIYDRRGGASSSSAERYVTSDRPGRLPRESLSPDQHPFRNVGIGQLLERLTRTGRGNDPETGITHRFDRVHRETGSEDSAPPFSGLFQRLASLSKRADGKGPESPRPPGEPGNGGGSKDPDLIMTRGFHRLHLNPGREDSALPFSGLFQRLASLAKRAEGKGPESPRPPREPGNGGESSVPGPRTSSRSAAREQAGDGQGPQGFISRYRRTLADTFQIGRFEFRDEDPADDVDSGSELESDQANSEDVISSAEPGSPLLPKAIRNLRKLPLFVQRAFVQFRPRLEQAALRFTPERTDQITGSISRLLEHALRKLDLAKPGASPHIEEHKTVTHSFGLSESGIPRILDPGVLSKLISGSIHTESFPQRVTSASKQPTVPVRHTQEKLTQKHNSSDGSHALETTLSESTERDTNDLLTAPMKHIAPDELQEAVEAEKEEWPVRASEEHSERRTEQVGQLAHTADIDRIEYSGEASEPSAELLSRESSSETASRTVHSRREPMDVDDQLPGETEYETIDDSPAQPMKSRRLLSPDADLNSVSDEVDSRPRIGKDPDPELERQSAPASGMDEPACAPHLVKRARTPARTIKVTHRLKQLAAIRARLDTREESLEQFLRELGLRSLLIEEQNEKITLLDLLGLDNEEWEALCEALAEVDDNGTISETDGLAPSPVDRESWENMR